MIMNRYLSRKVLVLATTSILTMPLLLMSAGSAEAQLSKGQQNCINTLNKGYAKVAKTQDKQICSCLKDGAKGALLEPTVDACTTSDPKQKLEKAKSKTVNGETAKCTAPLPLFGKTNAATINDEAVTRSLGLANDLFGSDMHTAIAGVAADTSKCQQAMAKQAKKCAQIRIKEFNKCKKNALAGKNGTAITTESELRARCHEETTGGVPDAKGKIAKACAAKLGDVATKKCAAVSQAAAFPGVCAAAGDLGQCIDERVRCAVCLGLDRVDSLQSNCDITDNGITDASCAPQCGDGIIAFPEQCDDGATTPGDGCDANCSAELPFDISIVNQNMLQNVTPGNVGFDDLVDRLTLFADELAITEPDVITLQEAVLGGSGTATLLAGDLLDRYGLTYFVAEYGIVSGNAVLSRWPLTLEESELIPSVAAVPSFPDRRFTARVEVSSPVGPLDVYSMHLCAFCIEADRVVHAQAFLDFVDGTHTSAYPAIVGADFNSHTGSTGDSNPTNDMAIDLLQSAGWTSLFDGSDAVCDAPTDRSGCTSGIHDLTETDDTTTRRIDNIMLTAAATVGPIPPAAVAIELGPSARFAAVPGVDPNPECHFDPHLPCGNDGDCPLGTHCNDNDFCVRGTPVACSSNADCPGDIAADFCRTTLWASDHVGVSSAIQLQDLP
jgi:cysteine-rich repeat protein